MAVSIYLKAALVTGVILSGPWIFYQLWMFVAAGLYTVLSLFIQRKATASKPAVGA